MLGARSRAHYRRFYTTITIMKNLKDYFADAREQGKAIGHFNFSTADQLRAIVEAAAECNAPVMVATSEGEAGFLGRHQAVALVRSYQAQGSPVFLNADHHTTFSAVKEAIDAGYDSVLIDGSKLPFEDNVAVTQKVVDYAKSKNTGFQVEGELGYLRGESKIQDSVAIQRSDYTKPEEAEEFVRRTGVDRLAIVFGNVHGIVTEQQERLDLDVLPDVASLLKNTFLVLHGASGLRDDDIKNAIKGGIVNIHFNTELRVTYYKALVTSLKNKPEDTTPYHYLQAPFEAVRNIVREKLKLFGW